MSRRRPDQVEVVAIGEQAAITLLRGLGQGVLPAPRLDHHGFGQVGVQHLIPADHDLPMLTHNLLQALIEVGL